MSLNQSLISDFSVLNTFDFCVQFFINTLCILSPSILLLKSFRIFSISFSLSRISRYYFYSFRLFCFPVQIENSPWLSVFFLCHTNLSFLQDIYHFPVLPFHCHCSSYPISFFWRDSITQSPVTPSDDLCGVFSCGSSIRGIMRFLIRLSTHVTTYLFHITFTNSRKR